MKKLSLLLACLLLGASSFAQKHQDDVYAMPGRDTSKDESTEGVPLIYDTVVYVKDSASKTELFSRARKWMAASFNNSKKVIQYENKDLGEISGDANIRTLGIKSPLGEYEYNGVVSFYITIQVKDGRYKLTIKNFDHKCTEQSNPHVASGNFTLGLLSTAPAPPKYMLKDSWLSHKKKVKYWQFVKEQVDDNVTLLMSSLEKGMNIPAVSDDW